MLKVVFQTNIRTYEIELVFSQKEFAFIIILNIEVGNGSWRAWRAQLVHFKQSIAEGLVTFFVDLHVKKRWKSKYVIENPGFVIGASALLGSRLSRALGGLERVPKYHATVFLSTWHCCCSDQVVTCALTAGSVMRRKQCFSLVFACVMAAT